MGRATGVEPSAVQSGKTLRFGQKVSVCPDPVTKGKGGTAGEGGIDTIAVEQGGGVPSG